MDWTKTAEVEEATHEPKCYVSLGIDIAGIKCKKCGEIHAPHPDLEGEMDHSKVWDEAKGEFVSVSQKPPAVADPYVFANPSCF